MLKHLHIRDFAIIDEIDLDLAGGMTALTGETGAGKSILLDALGLVLGDRADTGSVREGARRAEITADFALAADDPLHDWLAEHDLDEEGDCQLRRVVSADGRSRGFINARPAPLALMREIGERLVDIHGQHEHQSLRHHEAQRALLDAHGGHDQALQAVAEHFRTWREARARREQLGGDGDERAQRLDLLRYQVDELEALNLEPGEVEALDAELRQLARAGDVLQVCQRCLALLHDDDAAAQALVGRVGADLESLAEQDEAIATAASLVENGRIQLEEATTALRAVAERAELDPARLEWVEERLGAVHDLARKHRVEPEALPDELERLRAELDTLAHANETAAELDQAIARAVDDWRNAAGELSRARQEAAASLSEQVSAEMQALGMGGGRFEVQVEQRARDEPAREGHDRVAFHVAANPGQTPAPLQKVASGGELSRISLAIQLIASAGAGIPTQIFDEVDAGIGGRTAAIVGAKLRALADQRQVLCVTHLPQVAACGHQHLRVAKAASAASVETRLDPLSGDERVEEIARMLGGETITEQSRAHAREMLAGKDRPAARAAR